VIYVEQKAYELFSYYVAQYEKTLLKQLRYVLLLVQTKENKLMNQELVSVHETKF